MSVLHEDAKSDLGLFIELTTPDFHRPEHLRPLLDAFDRSMREPVFVLASAPPRHGKSQTVFHGAARLLKHCPEKTVGFCTYSGDFALRQSRKAREITARAGVRFDREKALGQSWEASSSTKFWQTREGGGFIAAGRGGAITGEGLDMLIVDDPFKDRQEAESRVTRDQVWEWWTSTLRSRPEPGASIFIFHQRWHPDDMIGRFEKRIQEATEGMKSLAPIEIIELPALGDDGAALWSQRYDLEDLEAIRADVGEYNWHSQYQQKPRGRGEKLFQPATLYSDAPQQFRIAIGVDMAYTKKTQSDHSVAIVMAEWGGVCYVLDFVREQCRAEHFADRLKILAHQWPNAQMYWKGSTIEAVISDLFSEEPYFLPLEFESTTQDKFIRAQAVSVAWNKGKVRLPRNAQWTRAIRSEVESFTGLDDPEDDIVDALGTAFDALRETMMVDDQENLGVALSRWDGVEGRGFG